ncbi:uncharacterized protein LOC117321078 [Pecten maximus]|uniref:uncharacterized protein LOC117321078 n=1 Tax=Pecten maximus TaxID=6579 RepID=UPI001458DF0C|nr:uncharacterized protein LOC117321078 [Pecten maximus]
MNIALSSLVLVALVDQGMSTCTYLQGRRENTAFGRTRYLCDFPINSNGSRASITFEFGSKFSTSDCTECECTADGMRCCGFGINSGTPLYAPDGCHVVADGCKARVVYKSDNRTDCYSQGYGFNRRPMNPFAGQFDQYGMFGMGGPGIMGQRRGQANGGEMESEGILPMLLPLLMGANGEGGMFGLGAPPSGEGGRARTGARSPTDPVQGGMSGLPPLFRMMLLSSMFSS